MRVTSFTHSGTHDINEDCINRTRRDGIYCFAVADGGGIGNGDIASNEAVNAILAAFEEAPAIAESSMQKYFDSAYEALHNKGMEDPIYDNMYASAVVLVTDGSKAIWGSIGDCRIYRFNGRLLDEVSEDDTAAFKKYTDNKIDYSAIRSEAPEIPLKTINTKSRFDISISKPFNVKDSTSYIMCSKGFWLLVTEEEMETALKSAKSSKDWLAKMLNILEKKAETECENISVYTIQMH